MAINALATGAAFRKLGQCWIPVKTNATDTYSTAQIMSEAMIPNGTSF
jgi:hypothetical protein